jgi:SpoVK/Ycf46/Vps4 family AAA+-type ATPase
MNTDLSGFLKAQLIMNDHQNIVRNMLILMVIELLTGFIKKSYETLGKYLTQYIEKKINKIEIAVKSVDKESVLYYERSWKSPGNFDIADSILNHILNIPDSQAFLIISQLEIIKNCESFIFAKDIYFQMTSLNIKDGNVESIEFKLFSNVLNVCQLREFVFTILENYIIEKKNNLGNKLYYFDHIIQKAKRGDYINKLLFSQHIFKTNRTLENVFHERQDELKKRVRFFLENKNWYDSKGVPYTLGLMFYGSPGTGKTSSIKSIANCLNRHIININIGAIKSQKQLKKLFYDEHITVCQDPDILSRNTELIIPIEKRLYVIEDADALLESDILTERRSESTKIKPIQTQQFTNENLEEESDIDLATILNIIDGTLETPGRVLIITSNHPDKFDNAFIRPGRIDMLIEFKKANKKVIKDMIESFYSVNIDTSEINKIDDYKWTPAEVSQILFKNFGAKEQAIKDLVLLCDNYFSLK